MAKRISTSTEEDSRAPARALYKKALRLIRTPRKHWASMQWLYRWAVQAGLRHPAVHYNYGRNLQEHGRFEEAAEQYRKAIELKPDYAMAYNNLGTVLCELGRYSECEKALWKAIGIHDNAFPHCNLAELHRRRGRLDLAERETRRALEFDPKYVDAIHTLAQVHEDMGELNEAEVWYREALELDDGKVGLLRDLGSLLLRLGRRDEGERYLRRAEELEAAACRTCGALQQWMQESRNYMRRKQRNECK